MRAKREYTPNPEDIETIFKVEPPLFEIEGGFGYQGVVLRDTASDKLQCHICGEWFTSLSNHVAIAHRIKSREYRIIYGLPLNFPLISRKESGRRSKRCIKNWSDGKYTYIPIWPKGLSRKGTFGNTYRVQNSSFLNKHGICEEQMERRFLIVADIIGKEPSTSDLDKHDRALESAIRRKYGNLFNFKKKIGIEHPISRVRRWDDNSLIAILRKKSEELGRIPRWKDLFKSRPNYSVIREHFGSWSRALTVSGLIK